MSRPQRILSAGAVLLVGLAAAWPFRHDAATAPREAPAAGPQIPVDASPPYLSEGQNASGVSATVIATTAPAQTLPPIGLSLSEPPSEALFASGAGGASQGEPSPVTPVDALDLAAPASGAEPPTAAPSAPRTYVIHNGDSLERIAARYLGDEGRALEIFDLNRDVLTNPYLLPLGAELTLPPR